MRSLLHLLTMIFIIIEIPTFGQNFKTTSEVVLKINLPDNLIGRYLFYPIGFRNSIPIFLYENLISESIKVYTVTESNILETEDLRDFDKEFGDYHTSHRVSDSFHFFSRYFYDTPDLLYGHSKLYISNKDNIFYLDSIYNLDKKIHSSFSSDGRYLLVNTLNTLSDYYNPVQDNRIMVYDLKDIDKGEVKKQYIPCTHCSDSYLIGDQLFFTIGRKDGYGGYSNKDIYLAPWGNLEDSVKVAANTDIIAISPDGKYILGTRFWDRQKTTAVIVDVEHKKYQMLLGRDYAERKTFYSYYKSKFAFDFKGYLIYVDFPEGYPFDALKWRNEEIPDWTEKEFWQQFQHPPLEK